MRAVAQFGITTLYDGQDGTPGKDGNGITTTIISYAVSDSGTTPPALDDAWSTSIPDVDYGMYLWTRIVIIYEDGKRNTVYSVSRSGTDGENGSSVRIISTNNAGTQEQIETWGKDGSVLTYRAKTDISDLSVSDQVILRLTNTTTSSDVFILGVVTALNLPESRLTVRSLGLLRSGSDATVTKESICNAILQELMDTELDGIYSYTSDGKPYIGINASAIRVGVINLQLLKLIGSICGLMEGYGKTPSGQTTKGIVIYGNGVDAGGNAKPPYIIVTNAGIRLQQTEETEFNVSGGQMEMHGSLSVRATGSSYGNVVADGQIYSYKDINCAQGMACGGSLSVGKGATISGGATINGDKISIGLYGSDLSDCYWRSMTDANGHTYMVLTKA